MRRQANKKQKKRSKHGKVREVSGIPRRPIVNDEENGKRRSLHPNMTPNRCKTCLTEFRPKQSLNKREYCSDRCRILHWWAKELLETYRAGKADGLQETLDQLAEVKQ